MATILNIETSTEICSVTLAKNGSTVFKKESSEGLNHSKILTVFIEDILKENNVEIRSLDAVAVSKGPGSYTGLRIGVSVAKGICYGLNIPLISVNSLAVLGKHIAKHSNKFYADNDNFPLLFCPMIDARRMEVYTSLYNQVGDEIKAVSAEIINKDFLSELFENNKILIFGNGAEKCKDIIQNPNAIFKGPEKTSAEFMQEVAEEKFKLKQFEDVAYFEPFYLKDFVATIPKNKVIK